MGQVKIQAVLDGLDVIILFTIHSLDRSEERSVDPYVVLGSLDAASPVLFDLKDGEEAVIRDFDRDVAVSVKLQTVEEEINLTVKTVFWGAEEFRQHPQEDVVVVKDGAAALMSFTQYKEAYRKKRKVS